MTLSVTDKLNSLTLSTVYEATVTSLVAHAIGGPATALVGAVSGVFRNLSEPAFSIWEGGILGSRFAPSSSTAMTILKTITSALTYFGSCGLAWAVLRLGGVSLTLSNVVTLAVLSGIVGKIFSIGLRYIGVAIPTMPHLDVAKYYEAGPHDPFDRMLGAGAFA